MRLAKKHLIDLNQNMDMIIGMIGVTIIGELSGTSREMLG